MQRLGLKRAFWRACYNRLAKKFPIPEITLMNYGFIDSEHISLTDNEEPNRYSLHLYHHVVSGLSLSGKKVVEVGSDRGGGAAYLASHFGPEILWGVDLSVDAVNWCKQFHTQSNLCFMEADAEDLPFEDRAIDVVVNIESSHCYPSRPRFFAEVHRILSHGGYLAWADMITPAEWTWLIPQLRGMGFSTSVEQEITPNVLQALRAIGDTRTNFIHAHVPRYLHTLFCTFAGMPGTLIYKRLEKGQLQYKRVLLRKL